MTNLRESLIYLSLIHVCLCLNAFEGYYGAYNLQIESNETIDISSLVLPVPEHFNPRYGVDAPEVELPDDSLADTDLRDHDFIDSLMYVYYGTNAKDPTDYGSDIIIVGSGLSCIIELITLSSVFLRKKSKVNIQRDAKLMFLHLMTCLFLSNLIFIFNIYLVKDSLQCQFISFSLYYLHVVIACSLFAYSYWITKRLRCKFPMLKSILSCVHTSAILLYFISFFTSPTTNYETQRFCFLSIQRGTIINYILPICVLILSTTFFSLNGIRKINDELSDLECDYPDCQIKYIECGVSDIKKESRAFVLKEYKKLLKVLCVVQCSYESVWFISVLALENLDDGNSTAIIYCATSFLLNVYIFWKSKLFLPDEEENLCYEDSKESEKNVDVTPDSSLADDIPLLINIENPIDIAELKAEYISTISN